MLLLIESIIFVMPTKKYKLIYLNGFYIGYFNFLMANPNSKWKYLNILKINTNYNSNAEKF